MVKKRTQIRPFRLMAWGLGAVALLLLARFPQKAVSLENQLQQLQLESDAYDDAYSRNAQLRSELLEINSDDFIERTARREYGYCWYGETIYEVANLDELLQEPEFVVYSAESENTDDTKDTEYTKDTDSMENTVG